MDLPMKPSKMEEVGSTSDIQMFTPDHAHCLLVCTHPTTVKADQHPPNHVVFLRLATEKACLKKCFGVQAACIGKVRNSRVYKLIAKSPLPPKNAVLSVLQTKLS